jgi:hypothetical protein
VFLRDAPYISIERPLIEPHLILSLQSIHDVVGWCEKVATIEAPSDVAIALDEYL